MVESKDTLGGYKEHSIRNEMDVPNSATPLTKQKSRVISSKTFDKETTKAQRIRIK